MSLPKGAGRVGEASRVVSIPKGVGKVGEASRVEQPTGKGRGSREWAAEGQGCARESSH